MKKIKTIIAATAFFSLLGLSVASATIERTLDLGDRGGEVTELQTYLSKNASIYPSGLVTGYFGQLTKAGVERFQTEQGIVSQGTPATTGYGRVGPITMARINSLLIGGGQSNNDNNVDISPYLSNPTVTYNNNSATISWTSNEVTTGQVFYDTSPLQGDEASGPRQQPYVSGQQVLDSGGYQFNHSITLTNLSPNTRYYFLTRGVDSGANMSMTWPSNFTTSN